MRKVAPALCLIGLLAGGTLGCIDHEGQLAVFLTSDTTTSDQAATAGAQQVNVEVTGVAIRDADSGRFLTLSLGAQVYELIGLSGRASLLALADSLDAGTYDAVRITFSTANSSVVNTAGRRNPLAIEPISITVPVLSNVVEDVQGSLTLTIALTASLTLKSNGTWVFRPVLFQNG